MEKEKINWDELKKKVDADLQKDIDEEVAIVRDLKINDLGSEGMFNLSYPDPEADQDYNDEGGIIDEAKDVEKIAWNNFQGCYPDCSICRKWENSRDNDFEEDDIDSEQDEESKDDDKEANYKKNEILCKHFNDRVLETQYIYPLNDTEDILLCEQCHRELAAKIMEQLALEIFI